MTRDELDRHLAPLSREELRDVIRGVWADLEPSDRDRLERTLARAAAARGELQLEDPDLARDVAAFAGRHGYADPRAVDALFARILRASIAGHHAVVRSSVEALLPPLASLEIDLGQDEMIDDVLTTSIHAVGASYLRSVYCTTELGARPDALADAIEFFEPLAAVGRPIAAMQEVSPAPLPDLDAFLPRWLERVQTDQKSPSRRDEGILREALLRTGGPDALAAYARDHRDPLAFADWLALLISDGRLEQAMAGATEAAQVVGRYGADFHDLAARLAVCVGADPAPALEAAFAVEPSYPRLARLLAGAPAGAERVARAREVGRRVSQIPALRGLLALVRGDYTAAAKVIGSPPRDPVAERHWVGPLLVPVIAALLADGLPRGEELAALAHTDRLALLGDLPFLTRVEDRVPPVPYPDPVALVLEGDARPRGAAAKRLVDALAAYTTRRIEDVSSSGKTRHYEPAARLVGLVDGLLRAADRAPEGQRFVEAQRATAGRKHSLKALIDRHVAR